MKRKKLLAVILTLAICLSSVALFPAGAEDPALPDTEGKLSGAAADTEHWWLNNVGAEALADGGITVKNDGISANGDPADPNINMAYTGNFVQSGRTMDFSFKAESQTGWTALFFRTKTNLTAVPSVWDGDAGYRLFFEGTQVKLLFDGLTPVKTLDKNMLDGKAHRITVTITDTDEGVKIVAVIDGETLEWVDESRRYPATNTGFAFHDCYSGTEINKVTLTDYPEAQGKIANAVADTDHWNMYNAGTDVFADNGLTIVNDDASNPTMNMVYTGKFVESGRPMDFIIKAENHTNWSALFFRTSNNTTGVYNVWDSDAGYRLWLNGGYVYLAATCDASGNPVSLPGGALKMDLLDGEEHRITVTITDTDAGVKIEVVIDRTNIIDCLDENRTYSADRSGFACQDYYGSGTSQLRLEDIPDTEGKIANAVADTDYWWMGNVGTEAFVDGGITVTNDGIGEIYGDADDNINLAYTGNFVQSGRTMDFSFKAENQTGWSALFFRTANTLRGVPSVWDGDAGYRLFFEGTQVKLLFTDLTPVKILDKNMLDGKVHRITVTITDTDEGVEIVAVIDGETLEWVDESRRYPAWNTGFAFHDCYSGTETNKVTLKDYTAPVSEELAMVDGAAVRTAGNSGLRFTTLVSEEKVASLETALAAGNITSYEFGTLMLPSRLLGSVELALDTASVLKVPQKQWYTSDEEGTYRMTAVLQGIPNSAYADAIAARAYLTVTYADGSTETVYSAFDAAKNVRSIKAVAVAALADERYTYTDEERAVLENYAGTTAE